MGLALLPTKAQTAVLWVEGDSDQVKRMGAALPTGVGTILGAGRGATTTAGHWGA